MIVALVSASFPSRNTDKEVANSQAGEYALLILPIREKQPRSVLERVTVQLREKGHQVILLSAEEFGQPAEEDNTPVTNLAKGWLTHTGKLVVELTPRSTF